MIKIFRKIRQKLLTENKFSTYLLYALGEILLVVIGILIALQISEWNETRKVNESIDSHLQILKQNLEEDQVQLSTLMQNMRNNVDYSDSSLQQIKTNIPVSARSKFYFVMLLFEYNFSPNSNAIETITQSNEIPYLKEDLRTAILNYYALIEQTQEREGISNNQIQSKFEVHINKEYPQIFQKDNEWEFGDKLYKDDPRPIQELSAEKLLNDKVLEALVVSRYFQSVELEGLYKELINSSGIILSLLNDYNLNSND